MLDFLKTLFLDKKARKALAKGAARKAAKTGQPAPPAKAAKGGKPADARAPGDARTKAIRQAQQAMRKVATPDRAELIRQAMEVHRAKQTVLAELSDEQRQKLVALALRQLLNEGREPDGEE